jgi:3-isopropylmalate/(R)-2-methylmalate dehydratase large subunit
MNAKFWYAHTVRSESDGSALLYIDRHYLNEVSSPQAFEALRLSGRTPRRPQAALAVADHNVPTRDRATGIADASSRLQVETLAANCAASGIAHFGMHDRRQGIEHVIGPEQGATLPGMSIVCGDSHTSTHGAFGALAFGIGTSEVEHVLATQTLSQRRSATMQIHIDGALPTGCSAKDLILALIAQIGCAGGNGYAIEFAGPVIDRLSMEGRMTLCNMAIEAGARAGMIAVDQTTLDYLHGRPLAPGGDDWLRCAAAWRELRSDAQAQFDRVERFDASRLSPQVSWGTSPDMVCAIDGQVPDPGQQADAQRRAAWRRALRYMDLSPGLPIGSIAPDHVFIGSCTNGRIEDLRAAAAVLQRSGGRIAGNIKSALVVPGSGPVKRQAEHEGLDQIFLAAGFEWREPGCSMCMAMNADRLQAGDRCASTSNRNFEGRQGAGGRTHLLSPAMAAAAALAGHFIDVREI